MLFFTFLLCTATWHLGVSTSCAAVTGNTCEKTGFVTGTCNKGTCDCINVYEPTRMGCIEKVKPAVLTAANDGRNPEAISKGSGEVFVGGKIGLDCSPPISGMTYVWSKDNVDVSVGTNSALLLSSVNSSHSGQYRCKYRMDASDYVSDLSDPVTVKVVPVNGTFGNQPIVTGMYNRSILNAVIPLECTNTPSGIGLTYEWYLGGTSTNVRTRDYNLIITNQTVSKNVTCKIGQSPPVTSTVLALPESVPVNTPSTLTEDISGATILDARGDTIITRPIDSNISLECAISDTDLAVVVTYKWTKNGADISQTSSIYTKIKATTADAGVYQCSANVGTRAAKQSTNLTLQVEMYSFTNTPRGRHNCQACRDKFSLLYILCRHFESAHAKNRHTCNFCNRTFSYGTNLKRQIKSHHQAPPQAGRQAISCSIIACQGTFTRKCFT